MKRKTAMQELIDKISSLDYSTSADDAWRILKQYIKNQNLLEKEKQQIVDAANWGIDEAYDRINGGIGMAWHVSKTPESYYNQTYKQ